MHPRINLKNNTFEFTDRYQMAGNVHKMKVGFTRNATRWQGATLHRIQSHGSADDIRIKDTTN